MAALRAWLGERFSFRMSAPRALPALTHSRPVWVDQNFAGLAGLQALHCRRKIFHCDAVGDCRAEVQLSGLEQCRHLISGLVHATAVDSLDRNSLENNVFRKVQRYGF